MEAELNTTIKDGIIFFVSEYDCPACSAHNYEKISSIAGDYQTGTRYGLCLVQKASSSLHSEFIQLTRDEIAWKRTLNGTLFGMVSQNSNRHNSPFAIKIHNHRITEIISINKE
ncbi:MAG: hypothetical protein ACK514_16550 [Bacteroidota bacterium]|nr:hypothetical protein [Cytophagales bacterium]